MPNEPLVKKMPSAGAMLNKLSEMIPKEGDFSETPEELEARGDTSTPAASTATLPSEAPTSVETPSEAPELPLGTETPPQATETTKPSETPITTPPAPVDEWVDIEYDDTDRGEKYVVRAKKEYADKVRNGYGRQSAMSRATGYAAKYKALLEPLITQGRFDDLAAMIDLGERDPEFRNAMYEAYYRRVTGKPVAFADQTQPIAQPATPAPTEEDTATDPLGLRNLVAGAVQPLASDLAAIRAREDARDRAAQDQQRIAQAGAQAEAQTYAEFAARFPGEFTGNAQTDQDKMMQVYNYAKNADLFRRYGAVQNPSLMPGIMVMAKLELDNKTYMNAPPSTAMSAAEKALDAERQAREAAARVAATTGGGSTASPPPRQTQRQRPSLVDEKTGKKKSIFQIADAYREPAAS